MTTIATLFSGGECVGVGARQAGLTHLWGIEYDDDIANVARMNGFEVITADVMRVDPSTLPVPDVLHASPVCKRASGANQSAELNEDGTKEAPEDIAMGEKVAQFLDVMQPRIFTLENVYAYRNFKAFKTICAALNRGGYMWDFDNLNAADHGVPQTRRRLILRAKRGALLPNLPPPVRWVGWYEAIIDLIPTLPESQFATWQLARLPEELRQSAIFNNQQSDDHRGGTYGVSYHVAEEPSLTVTNSYNPRAFIVGTNANDSSGAKIYQEADEPMQTIRTPGGGRELRAWLVGDEYGSPKNGDDRLLFLRDEQESAMTVKAQAKATVRAYLVSGGNSFQPILKDDAPSVKLGASSSTNLHHRAWLSQGRVVKMTPRALARLQSIPDDYRLTGNNKLDCTVIGNGVSCKLYRAIIEGLTQ